MIHSLGFLLLRMITLIVPCLGCLRDSKQTDHLIEDDAVKDWSQIMSKLYKVVKTESHHDFSYVTEENYLQQLELVVFQSGPCDHGRGEVM